MATANHDKVLIEANKASFAEAYRQHTATFRAWLIAFGVGLPVFLASRDEIWEKFSETPGARYIAYLYLIGVVLQVCLSFIDKYVDWFCLTAIVGVRQKNNMEARIAVWWITHEWPSIILEVATVILFGYATYKVLGVLTP